MDVWVVWLLALMCAAGWFWTFVKLQGVKAVRVDAVVSVIKSQIMAECDCPGCVARRDVETRLMAAATAGDCDCDICVARRKRDGGSV